MWHPPRHPTSLLPSTFPTKSWYRILCWVPLSALQTPIHLIFMTLLWGRNYFSFVPGWRDYVTHIPEVTWLVTLCCARPRAKHFHTHALPYSPYNSNHTLPPGSLRRLREGCFGGWCGLPAVSRGGARALCCLLWVSMLWLRRPAFYSLIAAVTLC